MITSMTGYGRSERSRDGVSVSVELRSLNSRFLEVITRPTRDLNPRENDIREIVRKIVNRGKINVSVNVEREQKATTGLKVDPDTVTAYKEALEQIKKAAKLKDTVSLDHLLGPGGGGSRTRPGYDAPQRRKRAFPRHHRPRGKHQQNGG
ncbi:MAG: hypothetical protein DYG96_04375 [Chlorobi bacterium CHB2]|nr:hypothetical protein [Chlorobi bacterium CHB2]